MPLPNTRGSKRLAQSPAITRMRARIYGKQLLQEEHLDTGVVLWFAILHVGRPHELLIREIEDILKCDEETEFLESKRHCFEKHLRALKADKAGYEDYRELAGPYKTRSGALGALKLMEQAAEKMDAIQLSKHCERMLRRRLARRIVPHAKRRA